MTDAEVRKLLGKAAKVKVRGTGSLTGPLKNNGDGTYSIDSALGPLENPRYVLRFTAAQIESVTPL
jgi:hypothetical protein